MLGRMVKWRERPTEPDAWHPSQARGEEKLAEVKAVLERLHRISTDAEEGRDEGNAGGFAPGAAHPPLAGAPSDDGRPQPRSVPVRSRNIGIVAMTAVVLVLAGVAGVSFLKMKSTPPSEDNALNLSLRKETPTAALPAPPPPSILSPADESRRLSEAEKLMSSGKIVDARKLLLDGPAPQSADTALMLARSYDPNYLRTIDGADAGPDVAEAERWYRAWHATATQKGLLMEPERLDRIIRSMR